MMQQAYQEDTDISPAILPASGDIHISDQDSKKVQAARWLMGYAWHILQ